MAVILDRWMTLYLTMMKHLQIVLLCGLSQQKACPVFGGSFHQAFWNM